LNHLRIKLTDVLLEEVVSAVSQRTGNIIGQKQIKMIESRLTKRVMSLDLKSEAEYLEYFSKNRASEIEELISILTVHHTYFFREFGQFEFLESEVLPQLIAQCKDLGKKKIRVWSAACSRGHESYSLFMFIDQYLKKHAPNLSVEILGTDVDRESVKIAANGVYPWDEVKEIPMGYIAPYWVRGSGEIARFAKIKEAARKACTFKQSNLMETAGFAAHGQFDLIFCRNVFIYFQADDIQRISEALASQLVSGGYFFVGLSESLKASPRGLKKRGPSIYGPEAPIAKPVSKSLVAAAPKPVRVFCVDDSPVILKLLKAVLTTQFGFEIVGTAANGQEAAQAVEKGLQFDVMTLDVHMPLMTGVEYLEQKLTPSHPPVVMLTSASRDNMDLAYRAIELGAKDYIEKPSLGDLTARADEIRSKLKLISQQKEKAPLSKEALHVEKTFKTSMQVQDFSKKLNVVFATESKFAELMGVLSDSHFDRVPCVIVSLDDAAGQEKLFEKLKSNRSLSHRLSKLGTPISANKIQYGSFQDYYKNSSLHFAEMTICYSVLANLNRSSWAQAPKSTPMQILLSEDLDRSVFLKHLSQVHVLPTTSFAYMSSEFFGRIAFKKVG
jgi:chemotaxis protein methyltransferase CheR